MVKPHRHAPASSRGRSQSQPAMVIWQTGVNDAIRGIGRTPSRRACIAASHNLGPRHPRCPDRSARLSQRRQYRDFSSYVAAIADVARQENVRVLQRYRVMRYLSGRRPGGLPSLLAGDHFHMNDFAHTCIGTILADGITLPASLTLGSLAMSRAKPLEPVSRKLSFHRSSTQTAEEDRL